MVWPFECLCGDVIIIPGTNFTISVHMLTKRFSFQNLLGLNVNKVGLQYER
jgi:hypothetical protein